MKWPQEGVKGAKSEEGCPVPDVAQTGDGGEMRKECDGGFRFSFALLAPFCGHSGFFFITRPDIARQ
jgi:hypothetical protein